jgi:uncharacterized protein YciI
MFVVRFVSIMIFLVTLLSGAQAQEEDSKPAEKKYEMKQYWMVFLKRGPNRDQDSATAAMLQKGHIENIGRLADAEKILVAGPFGDDGDLRGIFIMDCRNREEADSLCATDPAIRARRLAVDIRPWWTAKGGSFK